MILNDELIAKITKLASQTIPEKKVNSFFINTFEKFSDKDKAKIISIFIQRRGKIIFYRYVSKYEDIKKIIKKSCTSGINSFYESLDSNESNLYFDLINLYLNINDSEVEKNTLDKVMYKFNKMLAENSINNNSAIIELLTNYIKFMAYRYTADKELNKIIRESQSFAIFERIIIKYIEKLKIDDKSLNDNLLMLLLEVRKLPGFVSINELLTKKGDNNNLNEFYEYIRNNTPIDSNKSDKFCESIILYKLSNSILPKEICIYIHKFYSENDKLVRIANMDLAQNYLIENGVNDAICFNDPLLYFPGYAGTKYMVLRHNDLSSDIFHEATHIIQKNNVLDNKNFIRYRYDMLKDFLIQTNIPWSDYNGLNHDKFLFEIDADIQGSKQCGMIMLSIGKNISEVEQEMLSLDEKEQKRINESRTIIINGEEVDKKDLFDSIILKKPEYVKKFPVFSIEYNDDGSKKTNDEILSTLESYRLNQMYTEEELSAIEICIFGDSIENKKSIG